LLLPQAEMASRRPQRRKKSTHMISNAARYRRYAAHCVQLAKELDQPADKVRALDMAEHWRRLADHAETIDNRLSAVEGRLDCGPSPPDQCGPPSPAVPGASD